MRHFKMALIGEHISRSRLSRAMDILCARNEIELTFVPLDSALIDDFDFNDQLDLLREDGFTGATVTHPFKTDADGRADSRSGYPATMGASNLLRFNDSHLQAFNTDFTGFKGAWQAKFGKEKPGAVAIAGAGGVARAIVAALIDLGASKISIWDQRPQTAQDLADQLDPANKIITAIDMTASSGAIKVANGLVNATPMGMAEYPGMAFEVADIGPQKWAFDAVYTPLNTQFLNAAATAGLATLSGFELFRHMALGTFTAYTDIELALSDITLLEPLSQNL